MHAWLCENPIGVDELHWKELPTPAPAAGEVLVEIKAASLNFPDLLIVQNKYQMKPALPFVPGSEYAGVVVAVGEGVTHLTVGQSVACLAGTGGFGTHALAPAKLCVPLPSGFPFVDAAAFIMIYATSHHALIDRAQLRAGETVLVLGAAGGVGTSAIQIAKIAGARVIAAASTDEKCALCKAEGADAAINYSTENLRDALKTLTAGKGPDVIYDPVGGDFAEPAFRSIAWRGRYLVVGFASGPIPALPFNLALLKGASIVGVFWGDFRRREPQADVGARGGAVGEGARAAAVRGVRGIVAARAGGAGGGAGGRARGVTHGRILREPQGARAFAAVGRVLAVAEAGRALDERLGVVPEADFSSTGFSRFVIGQ